jgi:hypothetical protein
LKVSRADAPGGHGASPPRVGDALRMATRSRRSPVAGAFCGAGPPRSLGTRADRGSTPDRALTTRTGLVGETGLRVGLWLKVEASRGRNDPRKTSW